MSFFGGVKKQKAALFLGCLLNMNGLVAQEPPIHKKVIVGSGIVGAIEAYNAYLDSLKSGTPVQVTIYEKSPTFREGAPTNTAYHICPSLTPDEILSVVPRGSELVEKLQFLFNQPGGIRVDDVLGVNESDVALRFKEAVALYGQDPNHGDRTQSLLQLGKMSMCLWRDLYDQADPEMKRILDRSNFNSCHEPKNQGQTALHDGYRIDLIYEVADAEERARGMRETYTKLGYTHCKLLTPDEVIAIDPYLAHFCMSHSELKETNSRVWKRDAAALWRPGGCLSVLDLLPPLYEYLKKAMGTYIDASGQVQDCFTVQYEREVTGVALNRDQIAGLKFKDGSTFFHDPDNCHYVFCPGESVGTLGKLGFDEPVFSGFAGAAITLNIPLLTDQVEMYKHFSHCMEVHKVGIVLAWQARFVENRLLLQASGTKAFYGDQAPNNNQAFAKDRHLVQLNMLNDVLSEMLSIAFGRDTRETRLTFNDLEELEKKGILERWVGRRAVAYDGFPTLGALYCKGNKVINARCTTHMGSGGVSFAPAAVEMSRRSELSDDPFTLKILQYADSRR